MVTLSIVRQYYVKFGSKNMSGLVLEGVSQKVFFTLSFDGHIPRGAVVFHEGFKADGQREGTGDDFRRS